MNNPNKAVTCTESPVWGWFVDGLFWLFDVSLIFGFDGSTGFDVDASTPNLAVACPSVDTIINVCCPSDNVFVNSGWRVIIVLPSLTV